LADKNILLPVIFVNVVPLICKSILMKQALTHKSNNQTFHFNRFAYFLYLILVAYLFVKGDLEWAITNLGIALVFDPFDSEVKWQSRPSYQKVWLIAHLTLTFAGFLYLILG
jgi:hypothetical protein